jgi:hypothetical protein
VVLLILSHTQGRWKTNWQTSLGRTWAWSWRGASSLICAVECNVFFFFSLSPVEKRVSLFQEVVHVVRKPYHLFLGAQDTWMTIYIAN